MKILLLKTNLVEGLGIVERAVNESSNLPILKNVLLRAEGGKIILITTNLELAVEYSMSGKVLEEGGVALPFSLFCSIIRNLAAERISIEEKEGKVIITTDNYEAVLQGQDPKEFPIIPSVHKEAQRFVCGVESFRGALASVIVAAQYSDIRPEISGVYFEYSGGDAVFAATDGFRLAEKKLESGSIKTDAEKISVIIPLKTASELLKVFKEQHEITIFVESNQILLSAPNEKITSRLIDGSFPDYRAVIPKNTPHEAIIERQEFINAVRLASSFSGRANDITLKSGDNKKFLEVYATDSALGESSYKVPAKLSGEKFSVVFNWRYLLDGLKVFSGTDITLGIHSSERPALLRNPKEPHLIYVVMPIKG